MIVAGNQQLVRSLNRASVFHGVRARPGISRAELAEELALSKSTVGRLVDELLADGWMTESSALVSGHSGRRPTPLQVEKNRRLLLGARINGEHAELVAVSLGGDIRELSVCDANGSADQVFDILASQIRDMYRKLDAAGCQIAGLGVAMPGPVHAPSGVLHHSDSTGWIGLPARDMLQAKLRAAGLPEFPLVIERMVACIALKHFELELRGEEGPLLYVHVGQGVAAASVMGGEILRGNEGLAGSCGHMIAEPGGPLCDCGHYGCANMVVTLRAMTDQLGLDMAGIRASASAGDAKTLAVMRSVGQKLGTFLFNFYLQYDPTLFFVGGPAFQVGNDFVKAAQEQLDHLARGCGMQAPRLQVMRYENLNAALGAATTILQRLLLTRPGIHPGGSVPLPGSNSGSY